MDKTQRCLEFAQMIVQMYIDGWIDKTWDTCMSVFIVQALEGMKC